MDTHDNVTLRDHITLQIASYISNHEKVHDLLDRALTRAREITDIKLDSMNQFRTQILDERKDFVTKETYESKHDSIVTRIASLEAHLSNVEGRFSATLGVVSFILIVIQIVLHFVK